MPRVAPKVIEIVAERLNVETHAVGPGSRFIQDLGADSLDIVELVMEFEEAFDIVIPDEDSESIRTIGQAVAYIERKVGGGQHGTGRISSRVGAKVIEIVTERLKVGTHAVGPMSRFIQDLGADSLDIVELVMEFEEAFDIQIPDEDSETLRTVGEVVAYIEGATGGGERRPEESPLPGYQSQPPRRRNIADLNDNEGGARSDKERISLLLADRDKMRNTLITSTRFWNSRVTNSDPEIRRLAEEMLQLVAELRDDLSG